MNNTSDNHPADPPVTITITRHVKPGCEQEYERLAAQLSLAASKFPGHLGTNFFRPSNPKSTAHQIIYKFDSMSHYQQWQYSAARKVIYDEIEKLLLIPEDTQTLTGLETWFTLPNHDTLIPPKRYKITFVTWITIYPLVVLILTVFNPILIHLPIPLRAAFLTLIAIPTMTYVLMPQMTKLFYRWLYPEVTDHRIIDLKDNDVD